MAAGRQRGDDFNLRCLFQHPGLTESGAGQLCEAAGVCLERHHPESPTEFLVKVNGEEQAHSVHWEPPSQRARNNNHNEIEATRDGAYALGLASVETRLAMLAIGRAEQATGADWYIAPPGRGLLGDGAPDLDDPSVVRLEVSGTDHGSATRRLREKRIQLGHGASDLPGLAAIVGFRRPTVLISAQESSE